MQIIEVNGNFAAPEPLAGVLRRIYEEARNVRLRDQKVEVRGCDRTGRYYIGSDYVADIVWAWSERRSAWAAVQVDAFKCGRTFKEITVADQLREWYPEDVVQVILEHASCEVEVVPPIQPGEAWSIYDDDERIDERL